VENEKFNQYFHEYISDIGAPTVMNNKTILIGLSIVAIIGGMYIYQRKKAGNPALLAPLKANLELATKMTAKGALYHNPLNIRYTANTTSNPWKGMSPTQDKKYVHFTSDEFGFRAAGILLTNYAKAGVKTLGAIIEKWAPPSDGNDTAGYIAFVSKKMGLPAAVQIFPQQYPYLLQAMANIEVGKVYPIDTIKKGLAIK
jgi:hypothetical protein